MTVFNTASLLKQILSDDLEQVYIQISHKALEWMAAGCVTEANALLETIWAHKVQHTPNVWLDDEALQVMWELSDQYPCNIPFQAKIISEIESENWERNVTLNHLFIPELDNYKFDISQNGYDNSDRPQPVLAAIEKYLKEAEPVGVEYMLATTCGALIAARSNNPGRTEHFIRLWGKGYLLYPANYSLSYLMRDTSTARYLLAGVLSPVFKLTPEACRQDIKDITTAFAERMQNGRILVYASLSWQQLLKRISELAISQDTHDFPAHIKNANYLGRPPASATELDEAEQKLQLTLPRDYKEFLLASNGFDCFSSIGVTLSSIDKVDYLVNVDKELVEIWVSSLEDANPEFSTKLANSIIVGGVAEEQQLLLIPLGNQQWECWFFSNWGAGETIYPGFRYYMEEELQRLESDFYKT